VFATPRLLASLAAVVVGLVLLLVESLWVILGNHPLGTADKVLLWLGFGLIAAGAAGIVWAVATETPADEPALPPPPPSRGPARTAPAPTEAPSAPAEAPSAPADGAGS
jgi:hypothetical protein